MVVSESRSVMIQGHAKNIDTMILPEFFDRESFCVNNDGEDLYDETSGDVEIDGECYDTVIVEGWEPELYEDSPDVTYARSTWNGEGELIAEICVDPPVTSESEPYPSSEITIYSNNFYEKRRCTTDQSVYSDSDDCTNLSWLMNFKLDDVINCCREEITNIENKGLENNTTSDNFSDLTPVSQDKPPLTYTKLIELALKDKGELTVSGIYQWITERYPFFKPHDDRWKNSVRHNLSINPHFRKGAKAPRGAGHLWAVAAPCNELDYALDTHRRLKEEPSLEQEVAAAAASILLQHPTEFLNPVSVEQVATECGLLDGPLSFTY